MTELLAFQVPILLHWPCAKRTRHEVDGDTTKVRDRGVPRGTLLGELVFC